MERRLADSVSSPNTEQSFVLPFCSCTGDNPQNGASCSHLKKQPPLQVVAVSFVPSLMAGFSALCCPADMQAAKHYHLCLKNQLVSHVKGNRQVLSSQRAAEWRRDHHGSSVIKCKASFPSFSLCTNSPTVFFSPKGGNALQAGCEAQMPGSEMN